MKTKTNAAELKPRAAAGNLPAPAIQDDTTTKSDKVAATISDKVAAAVEMEKLSKNDVFRRVKNELLPVSFDDSTLRAQIAPLNLSEYQTAALIAAASREFEKAHAAEIAAAENRSFAAVIEILKANENLFADLCTVCDVTEFAESDYIVDGKCVIYHGEQNEAGEYIAQKLSSDGETAIFYAEYEDVTTSNIVRAIRNYSYFQAAKKRLARAVAKKFQPLNAAAAAIRAALNAGFTLEQITAKI